MLKGEVLITGPPGKSLAFISERQSCLVHDSDSIIPHSHLINLLHRFVNLINLAYIVSNRKSTVILVFIPLPDVSFFLAAFNIFFTIGFFFLRVQCN